jgi:hypothetical protein
VQTYVSTAPLDLYPLGITIFPYPFSTKHAAEAADIVVEMSTPNKTFGSFN